MQKGYRKLQVNQHPMCVCVIFLNIFVALRIAGMQGLTFAPPLAWACAAPAVVLPAPCVCTPTAALAVGPCSGVAVARGRGLPFSGKSWHHLSRRQYRGVPKRGTPKPMVSILHMTNFGNGLANTVCDVPQQHMCSGTFERCSQCTKFWG